jgi:hypothetical protein
MWRWMSLLPGKISLEVGTLVEPLVVVWHAVNIAELKPGRSCLVLVDTYWTIGRPGTEGEKCG